MKIRLEHGLAYVEAVLTFRGRSLFLRDTILDQISIPGGREALVVTVS
jgi:hypothetical protein